VKEVGSPAGEKGPGTGGSETLGNGKKSSLPVLMEATQGGKVGELFLIWPRENRDPFQATRAPKRLRDPVDAEKKSEKGVKRGVGRLIQEERRGYEQKLHSKTPF